MTNPKEHLKVHFDNLQLPYDAQSFLMLLWDVFQNLDDWRDGAELTPKEIELAIYKVLVLLPGHSFFIMNHTALAHALSTATMKWFGANAVEDAKEVNEASFVWRAIYYDIVLLVVNLVHGYEVARDVSGYVTKMYGEKYEEYVEEFKHG